MKTFISIAAVLTVLGCSKQKVEDGADIHTTTTTMEPLSQPKLPENDSSAFASFIHSLANIQFYIGGYDSIAVTTEPTSLVELSAVLSAINNPFSKSDANLLSYKDVQIARKYHVERRDGKSGARPSATIIQMTFSTTQNAIDWFAVFDNSSNKATVLFKPKTELWLDSNKVYFIQTYRTPERDYIDLLKTSLIEKYQPRPHK